MKNKIASILIFPLLAGCVSSAPVRPTTLENKRLISAPYAKAFEAAVRAVALQGYTVQSTVKESGVISTGRQSMRLNEQQVDCGSVLGLAYTKDDRTVTNVNVSLILQDVGGGKTQVTVNSHIEGTFNATASSDTKTLSCFSLGEIERRILDEVEGTSRVPAAHGR